MINDLYLINIIEIYLQIPQHQIACVVIDLRYPTFLCHFVKRMVAKHRYRHTTFQTLKDSVVSFFRFFGEFSFFGTAMSFLPIAKGFLQPFHSIKGHELFSSVFSSHPHILPCDLQSSHFVLFGWHRPTYWCQAIPHFCQNALSAREPRVPGLFLFQWIANR